MQVTTDPKELEEIQTKISSLHKQWSETKTPSEKRLLMSGIDSLLDQWKKINAQLQTF